MSEPTKLHGCGHPACHPSAKNPNAECISVTPDCGHAGCAISVQNPAATCLKKECDHVNTGRYCDGDKTKCGRCSFVTGDAIVTNFEEETIRRKSIGADAAKMLNLVRAIRNTNYVWMEPQEWRRPRTSELLAFATPERLEHILLLFLCYEEESDPFV